MFLLAEWAVTIAVLLVAAVTAYAVYEGLTIIAIPLAIAVWAFKLAAYVIGAITFVNLVIFSVIMALFIVILLFDLYNERKKRNDGSD